MASVKVMAMTRLELNLGFWLRVKFMARVSLELR